MANGGIFGDVNQIPGYIIENFFSYLKWEIVSEWDIGFDMNLFNDRLTTTFDWYYSVTNNAVFSMPIPNSIVSVLGNNGKILNTGIEIAIRWNDQIGDLGYFVGGNLTTIKNEVLYLNGLERLITVPTIKQVRNAMNSFYGLKVNGVYQNQAEIDGDIVASRVNATNPGSIMPGDFRYRDLNNDDIIDDKDRMILGSPIQKLMYRINLGMSYKGFELSIFLQGVYGNKVLNSNRTLRGLNGAMNYDANMAENIWTS
ncbi:MAG: TonB-dependent receptor domain-containing protein [Chitinophagaceae bacterium]